jgi:K(+)-stimulated pyrophosphate-energized sodium pump
MSGAGWVRFVTAVGSASFGAESAGQSFLRKGFLSRSGIAGWMERVSWWARRGAKAFAVACAMVLAGTTAAMAQAAPEAGGGEANLKLPDLSQVRFLGTDGHTLLLYGILFCVFGLLFGLTIYRRLKNLPVHRAMREISELIYETCKTYLITQGKFLLLLETFIAAIIVLYFGVLLHYEALRVGIIFLFSVLGIAGSYGVAWFGIRVNTFANSRTAFAGLAGKPYPIYKIPLDAGMSIGMMLISVELLMMLLHPALYPG